MGDQFLLNCNKHSLSLSDMELFNTFSSSDHHHHHNNLIMGPFWNNDQDITLPPLLIQHHTAENDQQDRKRKAPSHETSSAYSSPQVSDNASTRKTKRGKKAKGSENLDDVIHVRAKRGQATDSHSLAERVRRGKINERLRCLQDIVPGCYKTMGMAVMLDEIINYVQSLQNQVEFLSMKLTAAATFNDFNSDADALVHAIQRTKAIEAMKVEDNNQQFCPLPLNFGPHQHPSFLT
ncbi:hypothetical protein ACS0TY_005354 [Phlomoides rotata]